MVAAIEVDVHIGIVKGEAVDVVAQRRLLADRAVGYADLQPFHRAFVQYRPDKIRLNVEAAVLGIGGDSHVVFVDIVQIPCVDGNGRRTEHQQTQGQQNKQLFHACTSLLPLRS